MVVLVINLFFDFVVVVILLNFVFILIGCLVFLFKGRIIFGIEDFSGKRIVVILYDIGF